VDEVIDKKNVERIASQYHGDGLIDIYIGFVSSMLGISMLFDWMTFSGIFMVIFLPVFFTAKKRFTAPRIQNVGITEYPESIRRRKLVVLLIFGLFVLMLVLGLLLFRNLLDMPAWMKSNFSLLAVILPAVLVIFGLSLLGWASGQKRMYIYAGIAALFFIFGYSFDIGFNLLLLIWGGVVFITGCVLLVRFIRKYPALVKMT
jgi:hypothetical protein